MARPGFCHSPVLLKHGRVVKMAGLYCVEKGGEWTDTGKISLNFMTGFSAITLKKPHRFCFAFSHQNLKPGLVPVCWIWVAEPDASPFIFWRQDMPLPAWIFQRTC